MVSLDDMVTDALVEVSAGSEQEQSASISQSSGVVRLVRKIIEDARRLGASDIHIETNPGEEITRVRLRRDGDLETYLQLPARLRASLVSRIKVMARLDISERRRPQDGKINFADFGGDKLELRVAVMPTHDGLEDVVLRLLAASRPIPLGKLGFQPRDEGHGGAPVGAVVRPDPCGGPDRVRGRPPRCTRCWPRSTPTNAKSGRLKTRLKSPSRACARCR
jgi:type II secretory ATPase GspE/PulE/Tfp pilus assembly ATPase PilB-like protein